MIRKRVTPAQVAAYLNQLIIADPAAMKALALHRVPCNKELADHPDVQVHSDGAAYSVGLIGILNGMFGTFEDGWGTLAFTFLAPPPEGQLLMVELLRAADHHKDKEERRDG